MRQRQTCQGLVPTAAVLQLDPMGQPWGHTGHKKGWGRGCLVQRGRSSSAFGLLLGKGLWAKVLRILLALGVCASDAHLEWQACHHSPETGPLREKEVLSLDRQGTRAPGVPQLCKSLQLACIRPWPPA